MVRPAILVYKKLKYNNKEELYGGYDYRHGWHGIYLSTDNGNLSTLEFLEVLYHEMCHQFCLQEYDYVGHGKTFKEVYLVGLERLSRKCGNPQHEPFTVLLSNSRGWKLEESKGSDNPTSGGNYTV